ncbi:MAG: 4Fe-4S binding protein, partial [Vulcanisaeta sp.]
MISRMREIKVRENLVRFILMFMAYWLYTVYAPTFLPQSLVRYPYLDWSMGLGTAEPLAPAFIPAIVGTYIINIVLSLLFGSRQLCSLMCSASYMWQGTFYDALKLSAANIVRRRRGLIKIVRTVNGVIIYVMLTLFAIISLMDQLGLMKITIGGLDPLVFLYLILFGVIWYLFFTLSPILGTYNCVAYGWCHWGLLNQVVSRIGLFKLRVKDPSLCVKCPTKDCARACP